VRLAEEFGFCYGVDRAVDYAYETRAQFPDRRLFLLGEIIHNPHVNRRLTEMGIVFLHPDGDGRLRLRRDHPEDVVILPAFGATVDDFRRLQAIGCILVDTTCGSVLNVWKRVEQYARDGFTALIHGKHYHEETRATASQALKYPEGRFLIVRDMEEARLVMDYLERLPARSSAAPSSRTSARRPPPASTPTCTWSGSASPTRRPCSPASRWRSRRRWGRRWSGGTGRAGLRPRGALPLLRHHLLRDAGAAGRGGGAGGRAGGPADVMVVIGGYNSSNTNHLAVLCARTR
jgi:4-hydroxy-3-methylbut-2-en-1-yl diphosphate reductase